MYERIGPLLNVGRAVKGTEAPGHNVFGEFDSP